MNLLQDKEISYYISSHTKDGEFKWPILPDPIMGEDFIRAINRFRREVEIWIRYNPERYERALLGYYEPVKI